MTKEQAKKILYELQEVGPEQLEGETRRLFEAIMSIAHEKDKLKKHNDDLLRKLRNRAKEVKKLEKYSLYKEEFSKLNKQLQNKDKIIDLMLEHISNITDCPFENKGKYLDCERMCDVRTDKECWKQYFENKAKEE